MRAFAVAMAVASLLAPGALAAPAAGSVPVLTTATYDGPIVVPTATATDKPTVSWEQASENRELCEVAVFDTKPVANPQYANWRFCASMFSEWAAYNGTFSISRSAGKDGLVPLLQYHSCTFAVKTRQEADGFFSLGDLDVDKLLSRALSDFSSGTDLFTAGSINCDVGGGQKAALSWQIYDPKAGEGEEYGEPKAAAT